ncbi:MAG: sterol desaturase family protein [Bacteroidota bacterium]
MEYLLDAWQASVNTANWVWNSIFFEIPWYTNYFWGLILISTVVWLAELLFPWRKSQKVFRKDFWLDAFYMFFNFFIFSIVVSAVYAFIESVASSLGLDMTSLSLIDLSVLSPVMQLIVFFVLLDFVQWLTHVALHRWSLLWQFHKVHHSVQEMGFAAHLRYHWMENILYKPLKTIGVMLLGGFEPTQAYVVHFLAITIGHLNHANVKISWGLFKYVFNNPVMHLWHHAKNLPEDRNYGVNYGISLSLWDYLFKTNYVPSQDGNIELGFKDVDKFPKTFWRQLIYGFGRVRKE